MKKRIVILIVYQILTISTYGQIGGIVIDRTFKEPLIGAKILEKGTENGVITDIDGGFELKTVKENSILEVIYTGYQTKEIRIEDVEKYLRVELEVDSNLLEGEIIWGCIFYPKYSEIGLTGGVENSTVGLRVNSMTPYLLGQRLFMHSSLEWRKGREGNEYLEIQLRRYNFPRIGEDIRIYATIGVNQISTESEGLQKINRQYISGEAEYKNTGIGIGLVRQKVNDENSNNYGLQLRLYRNLYGIVNVVGGMEFLKEDQYFGEVNKYISSIGLSLALRYRQMRYFKEYEIFIGYRLNY